MECTEVGGITDTCADPKGHFTFIWGRQAVCTVLRPVVIQILFNIDCKKDRQSCDSLTLYY